MCIRDRYKDVATMLITHITLKMSYSKCGLCLQDLEVIKPASGIRYIRCLNWKECPFFCPYTFNGLMKYLWIRIMKGNLQFTTQKKLLRWK